MVAPEIIAAAPIPDIKRCIGWFGQIIRGRGNPRSLLRIRSRPCFLALLIETPVMFAGHGIHNALRNALWHIVTEVVFTPDQMSRFDRVEQLSIGRRDILRV